MSVAQPEPADQRPSPGLTLNLSSNNPFRNRAASPVFSSPQPSPLEPSRPVSRNPFLDGTSSNFNQQTSLTSPNMLSTNGSVSPRPTGNAAALFDNLTLEDKPAPPNRMPPPRPNPENRGPPRTSTSSRGENVPPRGPGHRPARSQEEDMRARRREQTSSGKAPSNLDIFADPDTSPQKPGERRVRRNSDSSVVSRNSKVLESEEEKKRQERRRRERRLREQRRDKKPNAKLDIIDKLDGTSIYGTGLFHHDGPFDACNPHRNRQGSKRAPMHAFAKDSLNNVLGGGGPLNKKPDHATFLGNNDEEAFKDYSKGGVNYTEYEPYGNARPAMSRAETNVVSATSRVEPIHGEETLGLGTSTFLEGAPASRTAMQRRESEQTTAVEGGLSRKKSLAQKIRGINNGRRDYGPSGRITSPEGVYGVTSPGTPLLTPGGTRVESNPFFNDFAKTDENKREGISIVEPEKTGRARAPSSPRRGFGERLERRVTSDGSSGAEQQQPKSAGGGFLSRVKSLKGGPRKPRGDKAVPQPALS